MAYIIKDNEHNLWDSSVSFFNKKRLANITFAEISKSLNLDCNNYISKKRVNSYTGLTLKELYDLNELTVLERNEIKDLIISYYKKNILKQTTQIKIMKIDISSRSKKDQWDFLRSYFRDTNINVVDYAKKHRLLYAKSFEGYLFSEFKNQDFEFLKKWSKFSTNMFIKLLNIFKHAYNNESFYEENNNDSYSTEVDSTEVDSTEVDSTEVDSTEIDSTEIDSTEIDSTEIDSTEIDSTEIDILSQIGDEKSSVHNESYSQKWDTFCSFLTSKDLNDLHLLSISKKLNVNWPESRGDDTVGDFIGLTFSEITIIPGFGKIKVNQLFVLFSTLYNYSQKHDIKEEITKESICNVSMKESLTEYSWAKICKYLNELEYNPPILTLILRTGFKAPRGIDNLYLKDLTYLSLVEIEQRFKLFLKKKILKSIRQLFLELTDKVSINFIVGDEFDYTTFHDKFIHYLQVDDYKLMIDYYLKGKTLEILGVENGVTRERIRQKLVKNNNLLYYRFFDEFNYLFGSVNTVINSLGYYSIQDLLLTIGLDNRFELVFYIIKNQKSNFFIYNGMIYNKAIDIHSLQKEVKEYIKTMHYPCKMEEIISHFYSYSKETLLNIIQLKYDVIIEDNTLKFNNLSTGEILQFIINEITGSISYEEVKNLIYIKFGIDYEIHNIASTLQRVSDSILIERGVVTNINLLGLSKYTIYTIYDFVESFLNESKEYYKVSLIHEELVSNGIINKNIISHYSLLDLLSRDDRFVTAKGLMIGLKYFDDIVPLNDILHKVISENGPIHIREIQEILFEQYNRRVLDVTIDIFVKESTNICRVDKSTFNTFKNIKITNDDIVLIEDALQIVLFDGPLSEYSLMSRFNRINKWNINSDVVKSILIKSTYFARERKKFWNMKVKDYISKYCTNPNLYNYLSEYDFGYHDKTTNDNSQTILNNLISDFGV